MKTIKITVLGLALLSIASCKKTWTCKTEINTVGYSTYQTTTFEGSKNDMLDYEQENSHPFDENGQTLTTECN